MEDCLEDTCSKRKEKFVDHEGLIRVIDEVQSRLSDGALEESQRLIEAENLIESFRKAVDKYQEQPELLEPYLEDLIGRLTGSLASLAGDQELAKGGQDSGRSRLRYHTTCKLLYQLIKVSGFKSIGSKFPHDTQRLPQLVRLLSEERAEEKENWQTRFVLTVWLSIAILTPFDLSKFETPQQQAAGQVVEVVGEGPAEGSLLERTYSILTRGLSSHDSCQQASAYCLAKLLSRPDVVGLAWPMERFLAAALSELAQVKLGSQAASSQDDVRLVGHARALCYALKLMGRRELLGPSQRVLASLAQLDVGKINRELVTHLLVKLAQRAGLALLGGRGPANWRHKRAARCLKSAPPGQARPDGQEGPCELEQWQLQRPEEVQKCAGQLEALLSMLFVGAQSSSTRIRWSAAKGVARLASRLGRAGARDVLDSMLAAFFPAGGGGSEFAWHGGCLALAEMARFGLIVEERLAEVMGVIKRALVYDQIKGAFAVGGHVREAACYVCWALVRVYDTCLLNNYLGQLQERLLCAMLFDRELTCRRAASAAFQELLGRLGAFDGRSINLLTSADYQSVGQRPATYLELAPALARAEPGPQLAEAFVEHLLETKLAHWDLAVRRLAASSLASLVSHLAALETAGEQCGPASPSSSQRALLARLQPMVEQETDANLKHGALCALTSILESTGGGGGGGGGFRWAGHEGGQFVEFVGQISHKHCKRQLQSKQQAAHFLEALCNLVRAAELAGLHWEPNSPTVQHWDELAWLALDSSQAPVRELASQALLALYRHYYVQDKTHQDRLLTRLNKSLASLNEATRCGALRALSKLNYKLGGPPAVAAGPNLAHTSAPPLAAPEPPTNAGLGPRLGGGAASAPGPGSAGIGVGRPASISPTAAATAAAAMTSTSSSSNNNNTARPTAAPTTATPATGGQTSRAGSIKCDSDTPAIILMSITAYIDKDTREESPAGPLVFAEAKAEACAALARYVRSLPAELLLISKSLVRAGLEALLVRCEDYTFDKRGDIGVLVRRAAVQALVELAEHLAHTNSAGFLLATVPIASPEGEQQQQQQQLACLAHQPLLEANQAALELVGRLAAKVLQQAVSYNDAAREQAGRAFFRLMALSSQLPGLPEAQYLLEDLFQRFRVEDEAAFSWRLDSHGLLVRLLDRKAYSRDLWLGLLPGLGQASDLCARSFQAAIAAYLQDGLEGRKLEQVFAGLADTLERCEREPPLGRFVASGLASLDYLLTAGLLASASLPEPLLRRLGDFVWRSTAPAKRSEAAAAAAAPLPADPKRLISAGRVLCGLLQLREAPGVQREALERALGLLGCGFAKARSAVADQLYQALMSYESELAAGLHLSGPRLEGAQELLAATDWLQPLDGALAARKQLASEWLRLEPAQRP